MTINADLNNQRQRSSADAESSRLKQEQEHKAEASFQATYSAINNLFKVKQKKYQKTFELAILEGDLTLQALMVFGILTLLALVIVVMLWCLINVAIVFGVMQLSTSLWLGLLIAVAINLLLFSILFSLMKKVKHEVGFNRTKKALKGDS